jgi:hypothetical protein
MPGTAARPSLARGRPGPLGPAIAYESCPLHNEFAWDLMEITYLWPPD